MNKTGITGRIVGAFIQSRLTPLMMTAFLLLGVLAVQVTPREEEPQIVVPMADVFVPFPGASVKEVEELLVRPIERKISEIGGVEYVYSIARPGNALFIVRHFVGEDFEKSLVNLYDKLMANRDLFPDGSEDFLIKPRDINDVPIVTLTLWSPRYDDHEIRQIALHLLEELKKIPETSGGFIVGGSERQFRVRMDPARMKTFGIAPNDLLSVIRQANRNLPSGMFEEGNRQVRVETGGFIGSVADLEQIVIGVHRSRPVFLRDVAVVTDGPAEARHYVWHGKGPGLTPVDGSSSQGLRDYPAVTVAIAKKGGSNAVEVSRAILDKVDELQGILIPTAMEVTVTRDYGQTADEKANELLKHLFYAVAAVVVFLGLVLGPREAAVVALAIPLTLALTLFSSWLIGYTINRVTLFALIFSIGILVDDAIVVVENIYRHLRKKPDGTERNEIQAEVRAVDEVGNPTILATFTVIAALLPMAFVSGLMGPYMRPIPVNASLAMFFSLLVAFTVVPWFCRKCHGPGQAAGAAPEEPPPLEKTRIYGFYKRILSPLMESRNRRALFFGGILLLLILSSSLFYFRLAVMKMLPFDNKSELQLVIDMPEGTSLEETARVAKVLSNYIRTVPEVANYQAYIGTASPFNFNGLVRHYFLRQESHMADIQINLVDKHHRTTQSHDIARRIRPEVQAIARENGANVKIVEVPPGPPVQAVMVAEVYGPDDQTREALTRKVRAAFEKTPGVVGVDDSLEARPVKYRFEVDRVKASLAGISSDEIVRTMRMLLSGESAGLAHLPEAREPVLIHLQLPRSFRTDTGQLGAVSLRGSEGKMVPLSELVRIRDDREEGAIYHKNLKNVSYVTGNAAGREESPIYGILNMKPYLGPPSGDWEEPLVQHFTRQPGSEETPSVKWDGEWQITYETFRDMGAAFGVALLLIYLLIVGQFQSFWIPLVIMAPIPMTLIGIIPGHWLTGSYFTATSMIGFIALAGIIVRNSILLVDFIRAEEKKGTPVREAVIRAGAVRTRPILLTAAALIVGAFVIILDPIFQGLAVSLLFGVTASTLLTLVVIPLSYYSMAPDSKGEKKEI